MMLPALDRASPPLTFRALASDRRYDGDGRLHVREAAISKMGVSEYFGGEVPGHRELGLAPDRLFRIFRSREELRKAARGFAGLPLLNGHPSRDAPHVVIGAIGSDAHYDDATDTLRATISVWDASCIEGIEDGSARQLSAGYQFSLPHMEPGIFQGKRFDGRMVDLIADHVALVEAGRAGATCSL
jgi:hypothetical protein